MSNRRDGRRDVTLTTLIDLLVQIVFVFTLILIASGAVEGSAEERGFMAPEVWKTLVSIFDVDPNKSSKEQIEEIQSKYQITNNERDALRGKVDELDAKISELERKAGAPGYPPCRAKDGQEEYVLAASIDAAGRITAVPTSGSKAIEASGLLIKKAGQNLSLREFQDAFFEWRKYGLSRNPQCKYIATVEYDPKAQAGVYQPAITTISSIFRISKFTKQGQR
jgi:hypothetical protein